MALDLFSPLKVVSWASAHADCPMRYEITSVSELVITFGSGSNEFEFSLDKGALRTSSSSVPRPWPSWTAMPRSWPGDGTEAD